MHTTTEDPLKAERTRTSVELITKDREWAVALRKRNISQVHHLNSTMLVDAFERIYL